MAITLWKDDVLRAWPYITWRNCDGSACRSQPCAPRIGLALGGGFARGIAHAGVLRDLRAPRHSPSLHHRRQRGIDRRGRLRQRRCSPMTSPTPPPRMRIRDVARWSLCRMGFMGSERMKRFLEGLLKTHRFEEMRIPLGVVATDLCTGRRGVLPRYRRRGASDSRELLLPGPLPAGALGRSTAGRRRDERRDSRAAGARARRDARRSRSACRRRPAGGLRPMSFRSFADAFRSCSAAARTAGGTRATSSSPRSSSHRMEWIRVLRPSWSKPERPRRWPRCRRFSHGSRTPALRSVRIHESFA